MLSGDLRGRAGIPCISFASNLNEVCLPGGTPQPPRGPHHQGGEYGHLHPGRRNSSRTIISGLSFRYKRHHRGPGAKWELDDYALVVSLVPLSRQLSCRRLVETGPIITEGNQRKIMEVSEEV